MRKLLEARKLNHNHFCQDDPTYQKETWIWLVSLK